MDSNSVDHLVFGEACHTRRGHAAWTIFLFICALFCAALLRLWRCCIRCGSLKADIEKGHVVRSSAECLSRGKHVLFEETLLPYNTSHEISLVLLGGACVGKSTLVARFKRHKPERKFDPTIEDIHYFTLEGGGTLEITDTAGVDSYPSLRDEAIRKADCFMLVFDVRDRNSFAYLEAIIASMREERKDQPPVLFVGNRASERGGMVITKKQGEELALEFGGKYMEVSDDQENVGDVFSAALFNVTKA
ncbi:Ras small monomeric GTPAse [Apiospora marii]|uniref:Ras small monomeric GTPAse n=1 Tax=Apiospora marii TaxID=335849 RepID=A0ABR1RJW4_9PEZI